MIKLWIDDVRNSPDPDWIIVHSVNAAKTAIKWYEHQYNHDTILLSFDHDAGDYAKDGGDYIEILNWLEREGIVDTGYFFHIHSMNPVGVQNMKAIIEHNGWRLIK